MGIADSTVIYFSRPPAPSNTQGGKPPLRAAREDNRSQPAPEAAAAFSLLETLKLPLIF